MLSSFALCGGGDHGFMLVCAIRFHRLLDHGRRVLGLARLSCLVLLRTATTRLSPILAGARPPLLLLATCVGSSRSRSLFSSDSCFFLSPPSIELCFSFLFPFLEPLLFLDLQETQWGDLELTLLRLYTFFELLNVLEGW